MPSLYLYGFSRARPSRLKRGLRREALRALRVGGLWCVIGEMDEGPAVTPRVLKAHHRVVRALFAKLDPFLPARFGTLLRDEKELRGAVSVQSSALVAALKTVQGCEQMNLRIFGSPDPRPARPSGGKLGEGARYLHQRLESEQWKRSLPELEPLQPALAPWMRGARAERQDRPPLIGTAFHLIPRGSARLYRAALKRSAPSVSPRRVEMSGPFPPYAFGPETSP